MSVQRWSILTFAVVFGHSAAARADFTSDAAAVHSGECLDVEGASMQDGARVLTSACTGAASQSVFFRLVTPTTDIYTLEFQHSGSCLTVDNGGTSPGTRLIQWGCQGTTDQHFELIYTGAVGEYQFEGVDSALVVEIDNTSGATPYAQLGLGMGGHQTFSLRSSAANPSPNAAALGSWGPVIYWPHIAVSMANLPDGRVLTWSGSERETWPTTEQTYTATWDPVTNNFVDIFTLGHNMFCASQAMMADGRVFVNGGRNQKRSPWVSVFDWRDNSWGSLENMRSGGRWYPTTIALADGDVYTAMGTATLERTPERFDERSGWTLQPDANFGQMVLDPYNGSHGEARWWPLLSVAPNGKVLHSGPTPQMHWVNTDGLGDYETTGPQLTTWYHKHGTTVVYDEGKILTAGGWTNGGSIASTNQAFTIDMNGPAPVVNGTSSMNFARKFHVGVVLPTGQVLVVGGNTSGRKFSDQGAVLDVEFWDPNTGNWTLGAPASIPRGYHSTATLLMDGRVLSAGGGYCSGNAHCSGSSHRDGQVYSPPYLFDASGNPAPQPKLSNPPSVVRPGVKFTVDASEAIDRFTFIKMSSSTHGMDTDQRFLEIPAVATGTGNTYELEPHSNPNVLTPGYWMLFGINNSGVPSVALALRVETLESVHEDLSREGIASQSSVAPGTPAPSADNAVDGDMSGDLASGSMARTDSMFEPWWEIDLRNTARIETIRLWGRTDCCGSELEDFHVFVSRQPFASSSVATLLADPDVRSYSVTGQVDRLLELDIGTVGRYVRVQKNGTGHLALDEIQVFGEANLALLGSATQSSQYGSATQFGPEKAIDGNRRGDAKLNTVTHTNAETEAWWELDLGGVASLEEVVIHNRTDCCSSRLSNFYVFVSSVPFTSTSVADTLVQPGVSAYSVASLSGDSVTVSTPRDGQYIRIQLQGNEPLSLAEVEVRGAMSALEVQPVSTPPQLVGTTVAYQTSAVGTPPIEFNWNFGDGTSTGWGKSTSVNHVYSQAGRYVVSLQVRDGSGASETLYSTQVVHRPLTSKAPQASSTILVDGPGMGSLVWNVNPDNDIVTVTQAGAFVTQIDVGDGPWSLAKAPLLDQVWVANKKDATLSVIDTNLYQVVRTLELSPGSMPHGIAFAPDSNRVYVALEGTGQVVRFDAASFTQDRVAFLGGRVRHVSVDASGTEVYVSRFVTPPLPGEQGSAPQVEINGQLFGGEVEVLDGGLTPLDTVVLRHSDRTASEHSGPGIPNYLGPAVISPDGTQAWVPSKQDNILAGNLRNGIGLTFEHTVRGISSMIDLNTRQENFAFRVDHDNSSVATHAAFGPYGAYMFTALEGNRQVAVSDTFAGVELFRFDVGRAPQGLAMSPDGRVLYVHNFLDRTVSAFDVSGIVDDHGTDAFELWSANTVGAEALAPEVLLGKQLFYDARDDRLALDDYMACASCHNDGGQDGRIWDFTGFGEGVRNTIALQGRAGMDHGMLHWSANFDEVQDFENQIRGFAGGKGLMNDVDFLATEALLGPPKAGLSADLDALAAYLASLTEYPDSPFRAENGVLSPSADSGRQYFEQQRCADCHMDQGLTDSASGRRHDVGTITADSGGRMGGLLDGIDTPSLRDAWLTGPYLHDGSALSLEDAVMAHSTVTLTANQAMDVAAYLQELEPVYADSGTIDEIVRYVPLSLFDDPIIVLGPPSRNGGDPSTTRLQNVTASGFEYFLDEWDYLDGPHMDESIGYLVMDQSQKELGGLAADSGQVLLDDQWIRVDFPQPFSTRPVVLTQVATFADTQAVTVRTRNVTGNGFEIRLQEEEAADGKHGTELVHWIAVEPGNGSVLGRPFEVGIQSKVTHRWKTISFSRSYTDPILLVDMLTFAGNNTADMRYRNLGTTSVQVMVEEEKSLDNEVNHVNEDVGYIIIGR